MSSIIRATTTSGLQIAPDNSGSLQLQTNGTTTAVTIDTSQNVGIGTTSPLSKVDVVGIGNYDGVIRVRSTGTNTPAVVLGVDAIASAAGYVGTLNNLPFQIRTNDTERMRIDSSGNLLVGTTSTSSSTRGWKTLNSGSNTIIGENDTGNVDVFEFYRGTAGSLVRVGNIRTNGTNTTYTTSSDYRLKDNIAPIIGALDKVALLKPVTYTWKQDGSDGQGFIAHELQEVIPDCVTGEKDDVETYTDEDGIEQTRIKPQGIDTSFLVATLTAAIQEQQTIINDLKARIETLEAK